MTYNFQIDKIVSYLSSYKEQLEVLYSWTPKLNKLSDIIPLTDIEIKKISFSDLSNFQKDVNLKNIF